MIDLILDDKIDEAVRFVQEVMAQVYAGEIPIDDLALTKKLSQKPEEYKSTAPHVDLALRLKGKYQDYTYYAERQLWEPIQRIMDLVVERNVFRRRRVTAPITSGAMAKFVKVTKRKRTQRVIKDLPAKKKVTDADIRSFFG